MELITFLFTELLYRPLFNGMIALYNVLPGRDLGLAILTLTVIVRIILYPLVDRQYRSQLAMAKLQPKMQDIRKKTADRQEQSRKLMALYKEEGVHPASGCLPILIQLPVLFALYRVFIRGLEPDALSDLYPFVSNPGTVGTIAFSVLDLSVPNAFLAVAAGAFQYVQSRLLLPPKRPSSQKEMDPMTMMSRQMLYVMPIVTVVFALQFPAGLALYWVMTTILGILQQALLKRRYGKHPTTPIAAG